MTKLKANTVKLVLKFSKLLRKPVTDQNLVQKRRDFAKLERFFPLEKDVTIKPIQSLGFEGEWIITPTSQPNKVILYMHGGGFVFRSNLYRDLISRIARAGQTKAFFLDYSLSPEHPFPKALHETIAAYKWLLKSFSSHDIILAGDSAGGALVLSALHQIREEKLPNPACAVALSPATDAALTGTSMQTNKTKDFFISREALEYFINAYFQNTPRNDPIGSPLYGSLKGFPPLLIHVDKGEIMYEDSERFIKKAKREGVKAQLYEEKGLWHVWHVFARYVPEAREAINQIGQFIRANTL